MTEEKSDKFKCRLKFGVYSTTLSRDEIAQALGEPADKAWQMGDSIGKTKLTRKHSAWLIQTPYTEDIDLSRING